MSLSREPVNLHEWAGVTEWDPRVTLAVVFTDIIDSTTLTRTIGDKEMFDMLVNHFTAARLELLAFDACEIKIIGDAYMAVFRTADSALQFALAFRANTGDPRIGIRAGIHLGQVRIKDNDIYGLMVNYAARLAHIKLRGDEGIFLSAAAKRDIDSEYGAAQKDFSLERLSLTQLQGFSAREEVWRVETSEIRAARIARVRAKRAEEARKNPTPVVRVPEEPKVRLPDPPRPLSDFARRFTIGRPRLTDPSKKN